MSAFERRNTISPQMRAPLLYREAGVEYFELLHKCPDGRRQSKRLCWLTVHIPQYDRKLYKHIH